MLFLYSLLDVVLADLTNPIIKTNANFILLNPVFFKCQSLDITIVYYYKHFVKYQKQIINVGGIRINFVHIQHAAIFETVDSSMA